MKKISMVVLFCFVFTLLAAPALNAQRGPQKPERGGCVSCLVGMFHLPYNYGLLYNEGYKLNILRMYIGPMIITAFFFEIVDLVDAFAGKTLTELEISKNLRDHEFKAWHKYQAEQ